MRPTPFGTLFRRTLRGACPICGRGRLYHGLFGLRQYCPACGFRYRRAVEYGADGYLSGAITINLLITGALPAAALIYLTATKAPIALHWQLAAGLLWASLFPLLFHRVALALWLALDLRLNPATMPELAVAPPTVEAGPAAGGPRPGVGGPGPAVGDRSAPGRRSGGRHGP